MISRFIQRYDIDLQEAKIENPLEYKTFNDFFTRSLKDSARPINNEVGSAICPTDGTITQLGKINSGRIFQAKGHSYSIIELLGGSFERAKPFLHGNFLTIYLSPKNYHRVHMPVNGILKEMVNIPGRLFSVNYLNVRKIPNLFARNKRVACVFSTNYGPMIIVFVGAMIVSSIETVWEKDMLQSQKRVISSKKYDEHCLNSKIDFLRGEEIGHFNLGSTVIVIFDSRKLIWPKDVSIGKIMKMGNL
ncbi:MAG: phosphatidylserine decarboxylase [Bordetella sp.]|nr:MAG: phosphatidylserine decarboxylase [Bordetella sp.]